MLAWERPRSNRLCWLAISSSISSSCSSSDTNCASMPSIWLAIWDWRFSSCSCALESVSRRAWNRLRWPSISSATASSAAPRSTSSGRNVTSSCPSRSASSRPRRAMISKSCPSVIANCDARRVESSSISRSPTSTVSPSLTMIRATTPPAGCCTTCRFRSTSMRPEATIAPAIWLRTAQVPKPPTRMARPRKPRISGQRADQGF